MGATTPPTAEAAKKTHRGWYPDRTGARYVHVPVGGGKRKSVRLTVDSDAEADARAAIVREIASSLLAAGHAADALDWATKAAQRDEATAKKILGYARALAKGDERKTTAAGEIVTFKDVGDMWTRGDLARDFPDQVGTKRSVDEDVSRLKWLSNEGGLGEIPIVAFRLEHAEDVMRRLPERCRTPGTRRQYAQVIRRVLKLAVYPLKLIAASPIPEGFLPKVKDDRAKHCLYPDEEARFLGCIDVPILERITCGFLARMGLRKSEILGSQDDDEDDDEDAATPLTWERVDLQRGVIYLARSKTEKPGPIVMPPDVVRAMTAWRKMTPGRANVFADAKDRPLALEARDYRKRLKKAGVTRAELHDATAKDSVPLRVHDLRALFVTVSIAEGRDERWIRDRTQHKTPSMVDRYRRAARMFEELNLGPLPPLDRAIPELASVGGPSDDDQEAHDRKASTVTEARETGPIAFLTEPNASNLNPLRLPISPPVQVGESLPGFSRPTFVQEKPSDTRPTDPRGGPVGPTSDSDGDAVEAALAHGVKSIADAMARAKPEDIVVLADRMATLARELEARRLARAKVVDLAARRERR